MVSYAVTVVEVCPESLNHLPVIIGLPLSVETPKLTIQEENSSQFEKQDQRSYSELAK